MISQMQCFKYSIYLLSNWTILIITQHYISFMKYEGKAKE